MMPPPNFDAPYPEISPLKRLFMIFDLNVNTFSPYKGAYIPKRLSYTISLKIYIIPIFCQGNNIYTDDLGFKRIV